MKTELLRKSDCGDKKESLMKLNIVIKQNEEL
jgi:hypothetical protein